MTLNCFTSIRTMYNIMNTKHTTCNTCHKRQYERGQTYTPGENCECDIKHTDSVEAVVDQMCSIIGEYNDDGSIDGEMTSRLATLIRTALQATHQQQVEEAVKNRAWCPQCGDALEQQGTQNDYSCFGCGDIHYKLTPNHQD